MTLQYKKYFDILNQKGWTIKRNDKEVHDLLEYIKHRYNNIPKEYIDFLCSIEACVNPNKTMWLLGIADFKRQKENTFRWNEFEMISLESAVDDIKWQYEIKKFWDKHLPICYIVDGEYEYYAIRMTDGVVVHGVGPEFEETEDIANSFERFIEMLCY